MDRSKIAELREQRAKLYRDMNEVLDTAEGESRDLSAEETQEYERREGEFDTLTKRIERGERMLGLDQSGDVRQVATPDEGERPAGESGDRGTRERPTDAAEYREAFEDMLHAGIDDQLSGEVRAALNVGTAAQGGYTVPQGWNNKLVESQRDFGVIRQLATVITTEQNGDFHIPRVVDAGTGPHDGSVTAAIVAEAGGFTESEETFEEVVLKSYKWGVIQKISDELLHDSLFDLSAFIQRRCGQAIGIAQNGKFVSGTGTSEPKGITVAAPVGKTAASPTAIAADELFDLQHSLRIAYRARASWVLNDLTFKAVRKLKDSQNRYLLEPSLTAGAPDTLLGKPVHIDVDYPSIATTAVVATFGDHSAYWIRDVETATIKVLNELYAANGQVGYRVHQRSDGNLSDGNAVKSYKMA